MNENSESELLLNVLSESRDALQTLSTIRDTRLDAMESEIIKLRAEVEMLKARVDEQSTSNPKLEQALLTDLRSTQQLARALHEKLTRR